MAALLTDRPDHAGSGRRWCEDLGVGYRVRMFVAGVPDIIVSAGDFTVLALEDSRFDPPVLVSPRAVGAAGGSAAPPVITQCLLGTEGW